MGSLPVILDRLSRRLATGAPLLAAALLLALTTAACASGPAGAPESFDPSSPQITAQNMQFDKTELDVPANQGFSLVLFNKDSTSHNVSIYSDPGHSQRVFGGSLAGNGTMVYHVQALAPGTYYFQCDVHPAMKGTLVAS
jgi:plastocyanin